MSKVYNTVVVHSIPQPHTKHEKKNYADIRATNCYGREGLGPHVSARFDLTALEKEKKKLNYKLRSSCSLYER